MNFDDYNYANINKHVLIGNSKVDEVLNDPHACDKDGKEIMSQYDSKSKEVDFRSPTD